MILVFKSHSISKRQARDFDHAYNPIHQEAKDSILLVFEFRRN